MLSHSSRGNSSILSLGYAHVLHICSLRWVSSEFSRINSISVATLIMTTIKKLKNDLSEAITTTSIENKGSSRMIKGLMY